METIEQILDDLDTKELAAAFDVISKLPKTKENTSILNLIMEKLEKLSPDNFGKWIKQKNGASMRNYFYQ